MKKLLLSLTLAAAAFGAAAQSYTDALLLSDVTYYGTARSVAMGNAFTALGGDLGSIGINPAGSAVNSFSQLTVTPGVSINAIAANYNPAPALGNNGSTSRNSWARATLPNVGFTLNVNTKNRSGLKNVTIGFLGNATACYTGDLRASGINDQSSYMGYLAALANESGLSADALGGNFVSDTWLWPAQIGFQTGMINSNGTDYVGCAQATARDILGNYPVVSKLTQEFNRVRKGHKHDMIFNVGFNISDVFFVGANLTVVNARVDQTRIFREEAPGGINLIVDGEQDTFRSMKMEEWNVVDATGFHAKIGVIAVPLPGLRVGAAIQTPTSLVIKEEWNLAGDIWCNKHYDAYPNEPNVYQYRLRMPFRASFGAAYALPGIGLISADYEITDFSTMRYTEMRGRQEGGFASTNNISRQFTGVQHNVRVGAEARLGQSLSLRAGYNLKTSPEYERYDGAGNLVNPYSYDGTQSLGGKVAIKSLTHAISAGVGYSSPGSFFFDAALRANLLPEDYVYPYPTYGVGIDSPEIASVSTLWDVVMTIGWRF